MKRSTVYVQFAFCCTAGHPGGKLPKGQTPYGRTPASLNTTSFNSGSWRGLSRTYTSGSPSRSRVYLRSVKMFAWGQ